MLRDYIASHLGEYHAKNELDGLVPVRPDNILFTDWKIGDSDEAENMVGVEEVRRRIGDYLVRRGIFEEGSEELRAALHV